MSYNKVYQKVDKKVNKNVYKNLLKCCFMIFYERRSVSVKESRGQPKSGALI